MERLSWHKSIFWMYDLLQMDSTVHVFDCFGLDESPKNARFSLSLVSLVFARVRTTSNVQWTCGQTEGIIIDLTMECYNAKKTWHVGKATPHDHPPRRVSQYFQDSKFMILWAILFSSVSGRDPVMFCSSVSVWSPTCSAMHLVAAGSKIFSAALDQRM